VNEFARTRKDGKAPRLQVALYEYGNDRLAGGEGYVRMVLPFTDDLDAISEKLWQLTTNGGSEFCGTVLQKSLSELKWHNDPRVYKAVFIAGNEPFTQGEVDYRASCAAAIGKGVVVNTIHCGPREAGISGMWADGAKRGEGEFLWIDQERRNEHIRCPQDEAIYKLSAEMNQTYVPYGPAGEAGQSRQIAADAAASQPAAASVGSLLQRANAKASGVYSNAGWDLVDAVSQNKVNLEEIKPEELPEAMRPMSVAERRLYVTSQSARRAELTEQIRQLNAQRDAFLADARKQAATTQPDTFDTAAVKIIRQQMKARGYEVAE
jgi:hypothetical protein